jgi:hypothetical protein
MELKMTNAVAVAERYIALWNEPDPEVRKALLAQDWADDATYADPMMAGRGAAEIDALIDGVRSRFPSFSFKLVGKPDGHGDHVRFRWTLGPGDYVDAPIEGTDFVTLQDGRISSVSGFLDRVPPM